jgi:hypothetical protein
MSILLISNNGYMMESKSLSSFDLHLDVYRHTPLWPEAIRRFLLLSNCIIEIALSYQKLKVFGHCTQTFIKRTYLHKERIETGAISVQSELNPGIGAPSYPEINSKNFHEL